MRDADTDNQMGKAEKFKTLEEAVHRAQAWIDWEDVEYGIHFELLAMQKII